MNLVVHDIRRGNGEFADAAEQLDACSVIIVNERRIHGAMVRIFKVDAVTGTVHYGYAFNR